MAHFKFGGGNSSTGSTTGGETIQEVASAISWSWVFWLGLAIFAGLLFVWMTRANRRPITWTLLGATIVSVLLPTFMGREMHFGPTGWSGWWGNGILTIILFFVWLLPKWSDKIISTIAAGGGILWAAFNTYSCIKGGSPPDSMMYVMMAALWLNMLFDFEGTDEIKAQPWLVWTLKLSGFAALACM